MNEFKYCGIILLRKKKQTTNIKFMLVRLKSYSFWNTENYIRYNYLWIECQLDLFNSCYIYTFVRIRDVGFWNFMHIHQNFWNHKHYPKLHVRVYGLGRSRLFSLIVTVHVREISNWPNYLLVQKINKNLEFMNKTLEFMNSSVQAVLWT